MMLKFQVPMYIIRSYYYVGVVYETILYCFIFIKLFQVFKLDTLNQQMMENEKKT